MKRKLAFLLGVLLLLLSLSGCGKTTKEPVFGTAADEIFTYTKLDSQKTPLVVAKVGNFAIENLVQAFVAQYPDIQVILIDVTGGNDRAHPSEDWITSDNPPDITINASTGMDYLYRHYEDLSERACLRQYTAEALDQVQIDGHVYFLPGPSKVTCMAYNKTMFEKYGWQVPTTFEELIELCKQIKADTGGTVEPWNTNAKYYSELMGCIEAMLYDALFKGLDNQLWLDNYRNGKATFAGHMEPVFECIQQMIDAGILTEESFLYSATKRGKEFRAGNITMINMATDNIGVTDEFELGIFPFPSATGGGSYVLSLQNYSVGVPKQERSEKKQAAINAFLDYISTPEAQNLYLNGGMMLSSVKGAEAPATEMMQQLLEIYNAGNSFAFEDMRLTNVGSDFIPPAVIREYALSMTKGGTTSAECIAAFDESVARIFAGTQPDEKPEIIANVPKTLSILEVSEYFADMFREATGAQIGLMPNNVVYRGNVMKIFAGDFTNWDLDVIKPRSYDNDATLVKTTVSGAQLLSLLNKVPSYGGIADAVYVFSGLKAKIAPWNPVGEKYLSITLADGSPIDKNAEYTIAFWSGSVLDEFITNEVESYEGSFEAHLRAYMEKHGEITAPNDGRITLVWE